MPELVVRSSGPLRGTAPIPGDKSVTHRALILGALAEGQTAVLGWVPAEVCRATLRCIQALGVQIEETADGDGVPGLIIQGVGMHGLREPADVLHCAGSGTTMRLLAGLLAGQPFTSVLTGTEPLRRRPMGRVTDPLRRMGATIIGRDGGRLAPLSIRGGGLHSIRHDMPIASAQVKSALLLAGLFAEGETVVGEPAPSRDHTERMLRDFGGQVISADGEVRVEGGQTLRPPAGGAVKIPADFSSAAFPLAAALIVAGSEVRLAGVGLNPTRTGLLELLQAMGAGVACVLSQVEGPGEPAGDLLARFAPLRATEAAGEVIVRAIDEFPIFAVVATQADGTTTIRDAAELRVKESDRIATVAGELQRMGAQIEERPDGMIIHGPVQLRGASVGCHRDHRLAMSLAVAGLVAEGETVISGAESIGDSFPGFVEVMRALGADILWR